MGIQVTGEIMASKDIVWTPNVTANLDDKGPDDSILILKIIGSPKGLKWFDDSSDFVTVDLDTLVKDYPDLFDKEWLRGLGKQKAVLQGAHDNTWRFQLKL